jgi:phage-related protein
MKVLVVRSGRFRVGAVVKQRSSGAMECELLDALDGLEASEAASGYRIFGLFDQVATDGLSALNSHQFHLVDQENGIYEFIAGRLRVLFFKGVSGQMVICTHLFMKKGQKTPDEEKTRAVKLKKRHDKEGADWIRGL